MEIPMMTFTGMYMILHEYKPIDLNVLLTKMVCLLLCCH